MLQLIVTGYLCLQLAFNGYTNTIEVPAKTHNRCESCLTNDLMAVPVTTKNIDSGGAQLPHPPKKEPIS